MFRTCMEKHANQAFTRSRYPVKKLNVYMAGGVGKYWVVDPGEKRVIRHISRTGNWRTGQYLTIPARKIDTVRRAGYPHGWNFQG